MKRTVAIAASALIVVGVALGDDVKVEGVLYGDVKIVKVSPESVTFRLGSGRELIKPLEEVTQLTIRGKKAFNRAENLISQGMYDEALIQYATAAAGADKDWFKDLVARRIERAKARQSQPKPGVGKGKTPPKLKKCPLCRGTGLMACAACRGTGLAKCAKCNGTGRETCPVCKGEWKKDVCSKCGGRGKRSETYTVRKRVKKTHTDSRGRRRYTTELVPYTMRRTVLCDSCGGKGWRWFCPKCKRETPRGTVKCSVCAGQRRSGTCPVCAGKKRVTCTRCGGTGEVIPIPGQETSEQDSHLPTTMAASPGASDPLSSPEALAAAMLKPKHPREDRKAWAGLTTVQKDLAEKEHQRKLTEWKKTSHFRGRRVCWVLVAQDISPTPDGGGFIVKATSANGHLVSATLPGDNRDALVRVSKGDRLQLLGTISDYRFEQAQATAPATGVVQKLSVKLSESKIGSARQ